MTEMVACFTLAEMTTLDYITPMNCRRIFFIVYPGFELLDLSGPLSVFTAANALADDTSADNSSAENPLYQIKTLSAAGGMVASGSGLRVETQRLDDFECDSLSSFLVVGSHGVHLKQACKDKKLGTWISRQSHLVERFGSVCTGAFVLQACGILANKTVTTHWAGCKQLRKLQTQETVLQDALYHIDDKCWTSAGVTTGIDMALEMLKRDHGQELMLNVAKYLVVYTQRPGSQSQFAVIQELRPSQNDGFASLINWLKTQLMRPVKVHEMATFMCMSERSFQRRFSQHFAISPSRYYERMRMEYARDFLLPRHAVELCADMLGYNSVPAFRTSFKKHFGMSPSMSQKIH